MSNIYLRASSLDGLFDCPRRFMAMRMAATNPELRYIAPPVGSVIGQTIHSYAEGSIDEDAVGNTVKDRYEDEGISFDGKTPDIDTAVNQTKRMVKQFKEEFGEYWKVKADAKEIALEYSREQPDGNVKILTGHIDLYSDGDMRDLKTGGGLGCYKAQMGAYDFLLTNNGYVEVKNIFIHRIQRCDLSKPSPPVSTEVIDPKVAKQHFFLTQKAAYETIKIYEENEDPSAIAANPMSLMCSEKSCPAHGTRFCKVGR